MVSFLYSGRSKVTILRMRLFSSIESYKSEQPVVLSIGNFDGLHRGHQYLLQKNMELASKNGARSVVLTFNPHPMQLIKGDQFIAPLYGAQEQGRGLEKLGIDDWIQEPFTQKVLKESPISFWNRLIDNMNLSGLVVGPDFRFGQNRAGDTKVLAELAEKTQVILLLPEAYVYRGQRVSSTLIRQLLLRGDVESASDFLGRPYSLIGKVITGHRRGRQIGFPTANILTPQALNLKTGVYRTDVIVSGVKMRSATNIGFHPTVEEVKEVQVETHILDFDTNIYGEEIQIEFLKFIRPEMRFSSVEALKMQIAKDVQVVRES